MSLGRRHIAIIGPPTAGHINPLIALGTPLAATGHRITFVHMAEVEPLVPASGVGFAPLNHTADRQGALAAHYRALAQPSGPVGLPRMIRSTAAMTDLLLKALPATLLKLGVDAVIADSVEPAGALVAQHLRLPFVTAVTGLPLHREPMVPPPFLGWAYRPDAVGRNRNHGGYAVSDLLMRPITRLVSDYARRWDLDPHRRDRWSERLQIAQCPAALDFPRTGLPTSFRYGSRWRSPEPSDNLPQDNDRPLVFCSLGSLQGARRSLFAALTAACAAVGARAVVAHGGGLRDDEAASLPGNPLVRAFWSQTQILPRCSAAILHCGFNTVLDALAAGVPIVAVPLAFEQPATAARLRRIGAACVLSPAEIRRGALEPALKRVLSDPGYREAARVLASDMALAGGATEAAAAVEAALYGEGATPARVA
ncbi:glycosyltransferase [Sphingomonas sp. CFBP 13720]|uniref:glycosyltransferase n=1 Tax=Sphingomonas sp. CFBP 13720 TaxID=2775302 RepID=UPI00178492C9|nr:glycosyltransferase [Sphingomonas sp. CFBP 13720]MBD8680064.1 glycosyltransferase family 1 protein [Sphingomonas sp. CFBP 13720]